MKNVEFNPNIAAKNNTAFSGLTAWRNASNLSPVMAAILASKTPDSVVLADNYTQVTPANANYADHLELSASQKTGGCCDSH